MFGLEILKEILTIDLIDCGLDCSDDVVLDDEKDVSTEGRAVLFILSTMSLLD